MLDTVISSDFPFFQSIRCPSLLRILLRILESSLLASRSHWTHRLVERIVIPPSAGNRSTTTAGSASATSTTANSVTLTHLPSVPVRTGAWSSVVTATNGSDTLSEGPATAQSGNPQTTGTTLSDEECERLCSTMLLTQNATVVHLLLEHCLPTEAERDRASEITVLREVRNIICTYIHYMFIAEPALADVIVWQTYPRSLLAVSAQAIPSLHICLDSVVNVFRLSGDYAKMIFCLDLVSHLSLHYNIQSALERAAFMIDSFYHILTAVVSTDERPDLFQACLPALVRLGEAFPSLAPVIVRLILAVGAQIGNILPEATRTTLRLSLLGDRDSDLIEWTDETLALPLRERSAICLRQAMITFDKIVRRSSAQRFLYYPPEWNSA
ncbi:hypothetical protein FGIG_05812 [Fasciola gigantica]|uniref:Uncharacterized protein n=1 Tax=Fasciola gigantica TaxID=46835 RepID=A0A504YRU0_FASGI|nr:hypothetical protein FGIG_05812 [Fasciola gigantica]